MADKKKQEFNIMPYWKNEEKCFEDAKVEGKDTRTGKKTTISWPRDKPIEQTKYEMWLQKVKDPDTGKFYEQRDKNGNTIKGTGPKHLVRQIVRIRTNDGKEWLYSNGKLTGFDVLDEVATVTCSNPETWNRTGFAYDKQFDQKTMTMKKTIAGPNSLETVYEMPFNEKNLKELFDKRMNDNITFVVKEERNNAVHSVQDATGIASKTFELFTKDFDYLYDADYISTHQKAELRQQAIEMGLLPREVQAQGQRQPEGEQQTTTPPTGTYS
jgi:hypothetical protein